MAVLRKIWEYLKNTFRNLVARVRPRFQWRWIITFILWLLVVLYVGFGVYFGWQVYGAKSEKNSVKLATNIYPFPAAFVGGNIIWAKDYYKQLGYIRKFSEKTKQSYPDAATLRKQIIDQLIENKILSWEASKNGIRISSGDVNDAYQKIASDSGGEANVSKVLKDLYGMSEKEFKELVKQQVTKEKIQNELIAQVKVRHILIKDEARANEVANKAKSGENWDDLAKTYSEDVKTRDSGGDLSWIARGNLVIDNKQVPEFEEAAFAAKIGEIFGPVKSQVGFQIGKVDDKKGKIQESYTNWLAGLKKEMKIFIFIK